MANTQEQYQWYVHSFCLKVIKMVCSSSIDMWLLQIMYFFKDFIFFSGNFNICLILQHLFCKCDNRFTVCTPICIENEKCRTVTMLCMYFNINYNLYIFFNTGWKNNQYLASYT